jgi:phosphopantetheinyl transferase (holo-ACP synthase)
MVPGSLPTEEVVQEPGGWRGVLPSMRHGTPYFLGNDVVDLGHPSVASPQRKDRLEARVLAPEERSWLDEGEPGEPVRTTRFWSLWAAKETAYKVLCKSLGSSPVMVHRTLVCRLESSSAAEELLEVGGEVLSGPLRVRLSGWASSEYVHLAGVGSRGELAAGPPPAPETSTPGGLRLPLEMGVERIPEGLVLEELRHRFSEEEWAGVHGIPSAWVRILARRRLAGLLAPSSGAVEILTSGDRPGRTPPTIRVDGSPRPDLDLSLSHHGRFVAWALLLPRP